jgi:hypothetical protein
MKPTNSLIPSLWSEVKAALLDLARSLRPPAPAQPVPVPVRPSGARRNSRRRMARF